MSMPQEKEIYSLAALFINSLNLEVTAENMEKIFKHLNIPFSKKLASFYELTPAEYMALIRNSSAVQVSSVSETVAAPAKEKRKRKLSLLPPLRKTKKWTLVTCLVN
ncbi:60s acidic ribosomal [Tubulinosema ratisbonensis]|uniref:60s acidic ribosomal n=1 Tax=Tubulinosema ratisbonensis TaxID=291195 RepID=A0A437AP81_9MICR|nr:60s acidic ribosomal [Tubulinosema ratisbonensis]